MNINNIINNFSFKNYRLNSSNLDKSLNKLSSGLRINRAADDPAGISISEKLRSQVNGYDQSIRNSQDSISMLQTGQSAINEITSLLQRARTLSVQSASDTMTDSDREKIQDEINNINSGINDIIKTTEFNTIKLFDRPIDSLKADNDKIIYNNGSSYKSLSYSEQLNSLIIAGNPAARTELLNLDDKTKEILKIYFINPSISPDGTKIAGSFRNTGLLRNLAIMNTDGSDFTILDDAVYGWDYPTSWSNDGKKILYNRNISDLYEYDLTTNTSRLVATNAKDGKYSKDDSKIVYNKSGDIFINENGSEKFLTEGVSPLYSPENSIIFKRAGTLFSINEDGTNEKTLIDDNIVMATTLSNDGKKLFYSDSLNNLHQTDIIPIPKDFNVKSSANSDNLKLQIDNISTANLGLNQISVSTREESDKAITKFDNAIESVLNLNAKMGSYQNRLEHSIENQKISVENLQSSESRIRDLDFAKESLNYSKQNILFQNMSNIFNFAKRDNNYLLKLLE
jgi:flagellin